MDLREIQPNKYSNEDQINMNSSVGLGSSPLNLSTTASTMILPELQPWNHLTSEENKVEPEPIPNKCACDKLGQAIKSISGFETWHDQG